MKYAIIWHFIFFCELDPLRPLGAHGRDAAAVAVGYRLHKIIPALAALRNSKVDLLIVAVSHHFIGVDE